jgi:hypothetical protein
MTDIEINPNVEEKRLKRNAYMRIYIKARYQANPELKAAYQRTNRLRHSKTPPTEEELKQFKEWTADIVAIKNLINGLPKEYFDDIKNLVEATLTDKYHTTLENI